jgi:alkyldihydroxyacetonephosphate synthase
MSLDRTQLRWNGWGWAARKDDVADRGDLWAWLTAELGMPALLATPPRPLEELTLPASKLTLPNRVALSSIAGADQVRDSVYERAFHARGRSSADLLHLRSGSLSTAPDAVVYPRGPEEVLAILAVAADKEIAVVPFGGGTSGSVTPSRGDFDSLITLDLTRMNQIIVIDPISSTATAEAGITGAAFENTLKTKGLSFGRATPQFEFSTLGGRIGAGRADGLIDAKIATPLGMIETGPLKNLIAGSQGAFGVVIEATLQLRRLPDVREERGYLFHDFSGALAAIRTAVLDGCSGTQFELCDAETTRVLTFYANLEKPPSRFSLSRFQGRRFADAPCLAIAGFEGDAQTVAFLRKRFAAVASKFGVRDAEDHTGEIFRQSRVKALYWRDSLFDRGVGVDWLETEVTWSRLPALYDAIISGINAAICETAPREGAHGIVMGHVRHAAPDRATITFTWIYPRAIGCDIEQCETLKTAAGDAVRASGGSIPSHIGKGGHEILAAVKKTLDPSGFLNPGKIDP